jgi:hypothetical protein
VIHDKYPHTIGQNFSRKESRPIIFYQEDNVFIFDADVGGISMYSQLVNSFPFLLFFWQSLQGINLE